MGIRCRPNGQHVVVEVNDSGIGIEPGALSRDFQRLRAGGALDHAAIRRPGTGIGDQQGPGGDARRPDRSPQRGPGPGRDVPRSAAADRARRPAQGGRGGRARQPAARPLRILLVEDHGVTAKLMRMVLAVDGHSVETAGDIATALELAGQHAFDLLLSDLGLPDGSGHDLMRKLRDARAHVSRHCAKRLRAARGRRAEP